MPLLKDDSEGGVSHQCRILAIEVLVTIVEGVAFNMSIVEGLLTIVYGFNTGTYCSLLFIIVYYL